MTKAPASDYLEQGMHRGQLSTPFFSIISSAPPSALLSAWDARATAASLLLTQMLENRIKTDTINNSRQALG